METDILIEQMVRSDILNIVRRMKRCHSKSMYDKLISDLEKLYELANIIQLDNILNVDNYSYKTFSKDYTEIERNQKNFYTSNYDFNDELTDNYIYILNNYPNQQFKYCLTEMSIEESQELVAEFLNKFDKKIFESFKKCVKNNKFIYLSSKEYDFVNDGLTFYGNYFTPYVLVEDYGSIFTAVNSIHEVGHIYDFNNSNECRRNYLCEIYSHFLELVFGDYLVENKIDFQNVKYEYLYKLEKNIKDLSNLLKEDIITNLDFRQKYNQIYSILEYTYGMVLALEFYNIYLQDKELAMYQINDLSKNKNDFSNPFDIIEKYNFNKEEIIEGKVLEKYIKRI